MVGPGLCSSVGRAITVDGVNDVVDGSIVGAIEISDGRLGPE
jgi:hypothetical protein